MKSTFSPQGCCGTITMFLRKLLLFYFDDRGMLRSGRVSICHSPSPPSKGRENPTEAKVILIPFTMLMFIIAAWNRTLSYRSPEKRKLKDCSVTILQEQGCLRTSQLSRPVLGT